MTFTHTHTLPEPEWVACTQCQGEEGWMDHDNDEWVICPSCDGMAGWLQSPAPTPSLTIVEIPPTR